MASRNPSATAEVGAPPGGSGAMFDAIADRYDLLNRVISLGVDRGWRRRTVDALALPPESTVLDLATGTGDLAFAIAERHADVEIIGVDPSPRMLSIARRKGETWVSAAASRGAKARRRRSSSKTEASTP